VIPSWNGDSVGHYDGDTLVIDTVGVKVGPIAKIAPNDARAGEAEPPTPADTSQLLRLEAPGGEPGIANRSEIGL
jgi:hypothetical protein